MWPFRCTGCYVPVNSKMAHPSPSNPRAVGNEARLDFRRSLVSGLVAGSFPEQRRVIEPRMRPAPARPMEHLTFVSKRQSAVGNKWISQFFDSAHAPRSRVIALVDSTRVFSVLVVTLFVFIYMLFVIRKANFGNLVPRTSPLASGLFPPQPRSQQRSPGNDVELLGVPFVACPPSLAHVHVHSLLLIIFFIV